MSPSHLAKKWACDYYDHVQVSLVGICLHHPYAECLYLKSIEKLVIPMFKVVADPFWYHRTKIGGLSDLVSVLK